MQYKQLGPTSIRVSPFCLGTMYFGTKIETQQSHRILDAFLDHGGNFVDTANNYSFWVGGNGEESETVIGTWMQQRSNRNSIVLATKVGAMPSDRSNPGSPLEGLRKETIIRGLEDSLRRLQTDYVDLFYIHADLEEYPLEERWEALYQLEKAGKIRSKGCSNYTIDRLKTSEVLGHKMFNTGNAALQQKMSYLLPETVHPESKLRFVNSEILSFVEENNMALLTYSVLLSGGYEKGYDALPENYQSETNRQRYAHVLQSAREVGLTPSQWVLRWISQQSDHIIPLVAASSTDQLKTNLMVFEH